MDAESTGIQAELRRANQNLAEVIDECVFVERQRDLTEQRLSAELKERDRLIANLLSSLRSFIEYLLILEERIVVPALGSFNATVKRFTDISACRASTIETLESTLREHNSMHIMSNFKPLKEEYEKKASEALQNSEDPFSLNDAYLLIRSLLDEKHQMKERIDEALLSFPKFTDGHLHAVSTSRPDETRELHQEVATLARELRKRDDEKQDPSRCFAILQRGVEGESRNTDELQRLKDIIERQERTIESLSVPNGFPRFQGVTKRGTTEEECMPQLKASETAIDALSKEMNQLRENYRILERRCADERAELLAELAEERKKKRDEQDECDAVLGRVTIELEQLVTENAQLKKRIRINNIKGESQMPFL